MKETASRSQSKETPINNTMYMPQQMGGMSMSKSQMVLVGLLLVAAFFMGNLYAKVQYLEKGGVANAPSAPAGAAGGGEVAGPAKYATFEEAMEKIADGVKLDGKKLVSCMNSGDKKALVDADVSKGNAAGVTGTPAFFINGRLIPGAVPFDEFKKVIDEELSGKADASVTRVKVDISGAVSKGPKNAPITLVEFSDFQCPFCERAFPTVNQVMKEYDGKVQLVYMHFPLISIHPRAQKTAEATLCALDQGKFWEFHDALFEQQADWTRT